MLDRSTKLFKDAGVQFLAKPVNQEQLLGAVSKAASKGG
jgi:FixJ family two-component response regulator